VARLARQWIKEQGIIFICIKSLVYTLSGLFGLAVDDKGVNEPNKPACLVDK